MTEITFELAALCVLVGFIGAMVANSTGAGGGIVLIPFFSFLGLSPQVAVATSLCIQSIGMTSGSISWVRQLRMNHRLLLLQSIFSSFWALIGVFLAVYWGLSSPDYIGLMFGILSLLVGWLSLKWVSKETVKSSDSMNMSFFMIFVCVAGGIITINVSIGIGEIVFVFLLLFGWSTQMAIACAVITTAATVLVTVLFKLLPAAPLESVVLWTGGGALVGGYLASKLVYKVGVVRVKRFCSFVILGTGGMEIIRWLIGIRSIN